MIFSSSKGRLAICVYLLVQNGQVDLDLPVARYWPEFAQNEKGDITVRAALSHRAGLPGLEADLTLAQVLAWEPVIRAIEEQRPLYPLRAGHVYHALTYGWIVGAIRWAAMPTPAPGS